MSLVIVKNQFVNWLVHGISSKAQRNQFAFVPRLFVALQT